MKTYEVILQIIALVAGILVAVVKKKHEVLVVTFAYNIFSLLSIFIKGDYTTVWSCVVINIRSIVYLFQDRLKKHKYANSIPFVVILAHIVLFILCFNHWYQVLTYVAPIILALALWFESDRQKIRLVTILSDTLWLIYNFLIGLYTLVITRVIMITVALVAYKKYANKQKVINDAG